MPMDESVRKAVLGAVPSLRAFAISLCGNVDRADDLVQETLLRALANIDSFQPGTNMSAWLFTILRNHFRSEYRKRRREVEDGEGHYAESAEIAARPDRPGRIPRIPRGAGATAGRPARGAGAGGRVRLLLRGSGAHLRLRGRHHQVARQPRAHAACRVDGRSRAPTSSAPISRRARCWRAGNRAGAAQRLSPGHNPHKRIIAALRSSRRCHIARSDRCAVRAAS